MRIKVTCLNGNLRVRRAYSTNSDVVDRLINGFEYDLEDELVRENYIEHNQWLKVKGEKGNVGYVNMSFVTLLKPENPVKDHVGEPQATLSELEEWVVGLTAEQVQEVIDWCKEQLKKKGVD